MAEFFQTGHGIKQFAASDVPAYTSLDLTGQNATIGTTTLYAVPSSGAGLYRVAYSLIDTSAGSAGTVTATIGWNNGTSAQTSTTASLSLSSAGGEIAGDFFLYSAVSQNITYATTVTGIVGSPFYSLRLRVQYLG